MNSSVGAISRVAAVVCLFATAVCGGAWRGAGTGGQG
jgi:hypothetical protein